MLTLHALEGETKFQKTKQNNQGRLSKYQAWKKTSKPQVLFQFRLDFSKKVFRKTKSNLSTTGHIFRGTNQKTP